MGANERGVKLGVWSGFALPALGVAASEGPHERSDAAYYDTAGLRLFWSWIEPGELTRTQSIAREGRTAGTVSLGLACVLVVSGAIEAFVTPSGLPTWARVGIGVTAELAFFAYVFVVGRQAYQRGATGDVDARYLEDRVATQA